MENPFTDEYFMKRALQEAELAFEKGEIPVGAIIVIDDKIIARGHNLTELLHDVRLMPKCKRLLLRPIFLAENTLRVARCMLL